MSAEARGITSDALLGGRVRLQQPAQGYRVAIDPVLLAAAVPARAGERVLDLGTGVGAAALCCATRVPGCTVVGLEAQDEMADLARRNVADNGLAATVTIVAGDVARPPPDVAGLTFDHAMANPPFAEAGQGRAPRDAGKRAANVEGDVPLRGWVDAALGRVRRGGTVTFIHRADRLGELMAALAAGGAGGLIVFPLWPKAGADCRRLIVQASPGSRAPLRVAPGLVLHEGDGAYTAAAQDVLRRGSALAI